MNAIRGAIATVKNNKEDIIESSKILFSEIIEKNSLDPKKKYNTVVKNYHLPDGSGGAANICLNANYISNTDVSVDNVLMKNKTNGLIWRPEHNHYNHFRLPFC